MELTGWHPPAGTNLLGLGPGRNRVCDGTEGGADVSGEIRLCHSQYEGSEEKESSLCVLFSNSALVDVQIGWPLCRSCVCWAK